MQKFSKKKTCTHEYTIQSQSNERTLCTQRAQYTVCSCLYSQKNGNKILEWNTPTNVTGEQHIVDDFSLFISYPLARTNTTRKETSSARRAHDSTKVKHYEISWCHCWRWLCLAWPYILQMTHLICIYTRYVCVMMKDWLSETCKLMVWRLNFHILPSKI